MGRALPPRLLCSSKQLGAKTPVCCLSRKEARGTAAVPALGCPPDPRVHTPRFILSNMPPVTVLPHRLRIASSLEPTPHPALRILLSPRPHHCNGPACHSSVHHPLPAPLLEHLPSFPPTQVLLLGLALSPSVSSSLNPKASTGRPPVSHSGLGTFSWVVLSPCRLPCPILASCSPKQRSGPHCVHPSVLRGWHRPDTRGCPRWPKAEGWFRGHACGPKRVSPAWP